MRLGTRLFRFCRTMSSRSFSFSVFEGNKIKRTDKFFSPVLHIAEKMDDLSKLQENIELRKMEFDAVKFKSLWEFWEHLKASRLQLEQRKAQIQDHIQDLKKLEKDTEAVEELTKLKTELRIVREDLKTLMTAYWEVEEKVMVNSLMIPNDLHKETPSQEDRIIHEFGQVPQVTDPASHLDIGYNLDLLDYRDPSCYFLKNEAALFEVSSAFYFADRLKQHDFVPFCNPDCARSAIVDACGINSTQPDSVFTIKENIERTHKWKNYKLHLVGGSSIYPFCAFHTKQTVSFSSLPLKYFTLGRQYSPSTLNSKHGLYDTWQKTTNEIFILTADDYNQMMSVFRETLSMVISMYETLNHHFRVVYVNASSLEHWEALRASFQMYSCYERKYIEIGKISISDSYICQRLLMTYQMSDSDNKKRLTKMISGTVVDITKLLACILEQRQGFSVEKFTMPDCFKSHWSV